MSAFSEGTGLVTSHESFMLRMFHVPFRTPLIGIFLFKILFIFQQRGREGEIEGEKYQCVVASQEPPSQDLACNPGM